MRIEDESGGYFSNIQRLRSNAIDAQRMHLNYLHALMLEIASAHDSEYAKAVRLICINYLSSDTQIDPSGGWYPYRTPWLTARVLISLSESKAFSHSDELLRHRGSAVESLVKRLSPEGFWPSGAGAWVSNVESTGLCLEALLLSGAIDKSFDFQQITTYVKDVLTSHVEHLSFANEDNANETLASVVLASVVLRLRDECGIDDHLAEVATRVVAKSLSLATDGSKASYRQFCTIPQVLYYALISLGV